MQFRHTLDTSPPPSGENIAVSDASRFRLLIESVKDYAIFILDPDGCVATWNEGAQRINGYAAHEIIGKHFSAFYPTEEVASGKCERELAIASEEGRFEEEGWRIRKDGSRFWAHVTITALRERETNALLGFAKVTRDLTERKRHEEEVRALAVANAELAEKARIQEFQERFVAILGHDLRNPLSAIDMGVSLLRQRAADRGDEVASRVLARMQSSSRRMTRMVEQILDLTRTRLAGGLGITPATMDLLPTINVVVEELRTAQPGCIIEVEGEASVSGAWDRDRLARVFSNLIGNAIHHGDRTRPVRVLVEAEGDCVIVTIHNYGPPIPESVRAELFSPWRRGVRDSRTSETEGLGLGLYISREIVRGHAGDIDVTSSAEHGTTFRVKLPRNLQPSPAPDEQR